MESVLMGKLVRGVEFLPDIHEVWSKNYGMYYLLVLMLCRSDILLIKAV